MPIRDDVNARLHRLTGIRLTRETPEQREAAIKAAADRIAKRQHPSDGQQKAKAAPATAGRTKVGKGANLPSHLDDVKRETIAAVRPRTMTGVPKLDPLIEAVRYVSRHQVPGEVVECGVWRGGSMQAIALTLLEQGDTSRELHLFDTFEGMPPPTEEDTRRSKATGEVRSAEEILKVSKRGSHVWAVAGLEDVKQGMAETGYPQEKVFFHPGMVEETTPGEAPEQIAILRLDTDWYASTKHELEHLYKRLTPGGVLILDDYGDWDGARKATDEWLESTGLPLFLVPIGPGRIAVKPS